MVLLNRGRVGRRRVFITAQAHLFGGLCCFYSFLSLLYRNAVPKQSSSPACHDKVIEMHAPPWECSSGRNYRAPYRDQCRMMRFRFCQFTDSVGESQCFTEVFKCVDAAEPS